LFDLPYVFLKEPHPIEFSVVSRQCLDRRIPTKQELTDEINTWQQQRNEQKATVNWRFKTTDARVKLGRLYPPVEPGKVGLADH
jgi:hypothetical protein